MARTAMTDSSIPVSTPRTFLDLSAYQWTVLFAAWLGWGFDIFDSLLFNYVAPNCIPTLLGITHGTPAAKSATLEWTGIITSLLLVGWGLGGIAFGRVTDRIGRTKTLLFTMILYSLGTAACAFAPNVWVLMLFRFIASIGIGGEWAAGAAMVAEVVPEKRRVDAGVWLYTAAPIGVFAATFTTYAITNAFRDSSQNWRYVFLCGLLPAFIAFGVRAFVREPERWQNAVQGAAVPRISELFSPELRRKTIGGLLMAMLALLSWWSCNAFLPVVASGLGGTDKVLAEALKARATSAFSLGGLIGVLSTIPIAKRFGRRVMFAGYFALGTLAVVATFGLNWTPDVRVLLVFFVGLTIFGIFGAFTFYLPELFPTRLRGTGAGFCYNFGRFLASGGPFIVGYIASKGQGALLGALTLTAIFPLFGAILSPFIVETRNDVLVD
ncbi:putative metabolite transport protein YjhB [Abditibacteriota bacterium]|nr:putative metabolite transport protein YjhB [Abditibacteriota bacterium]